MKARLAGLVALAAALNWSAAPAAAVTPPPSAAVPTKGPAIVIGFDVSKSISEDSFKAAQDAAKTFVGGLDERFAIGLLTVGNAPVLQDLSPDHAAVIENIGALAQEDGGGNTYIYDAVNISLAPLDGYDPAVIVLVTDAKDEGYLDPDNHVEVQEVTDSALNHVPPVQVSVIFVPPAVPDDYTTVGEAELRGLAGATRGIFQPVDSENFSESVNQQLRAAVAPVAPPTTTTVTTTPPPTTTTPPTLAAPPPTPQPLVLPSAAFLASLGAIAAALMAVVIVIAGIAGRASTPAARRQRGLEAYTLNPRAPSKPPPPPTRLGDNAITRSAVELADRVVRSRHAEEPLARRLEAGDFPLRPGEWLVLHVLVAVGLGLLLLALSGGNPAALLLGVALGAAGMWILLSSRAQRRRKAFQNVLPDTLGMLASTLRVGYSLPQAMDSVVREAAEPIRTEFNRALVDNRLGMPADVALDAIADRLDSDDFRWVVMAIRIQREVGGNLAELLDTVSETMRERARLRRQVDTLSAEGRISAWICGGLPVAFVIYLLVVRPGYLSPLVTDPLGILLLVVGGLLFVVGLLGLRWAVSVDI